MYLLPPIRSDCMLECEWNSKYFIVLQKSGDQFIQTITTCFSTYRHTHTVPPANTWGSPHTNIHPYIQWTSMHKCILHLHLYRCWYSSLCHGFSAECNTFPHTFLLIRTMWCVILHKLYHIQWLTILSAKFVSFVFNLGGISCCLSSLSFANYSEIFIVLSWFLHVHHLASVLTQRGEP